jgi:hypothetical protein|tara:strand:+ start:119 stop:409 length:291 start_codon:yes stop_codon:yes gene_type:complete
VHAPTSAVDVTVSSTDIAAHRRHALLHADAPLLLLFDFGEDMFSANLTPLPVEVMRKPAILPQGLPQIKQRQFSLTSLPAATTCAAKTRRALPVFL